MPSKIQFLENPTQHHFPSTCLTHTYRSTTSHQHASLTPTAAPLNSHQHASLTPTAAPLNSHQHPSLTLTAAPLNSHQNPSHLPQQFSDFFTDKTEQIRQNLDTNPSRNSHRNPPYLATPLSEFCSVSEEAILGITKKLHQKCCELDPIPTSLVYESTELLPAITSIISDSFQSDVFPHVFKRELVKPAQCVFVVQVLLLWITVYYFKDIYWCVSEHVLYCISIFVLI